MQLSHIFFDINETLIDIAPLREAIAARLGNTDGAGKRWFDAVITYSHAETLMGTRTEFSDVAAAVLVMLGAEKFAEQPITPDAARFDSDLGEFVLPYEAVRRASNPWHLLLDFLTSTFEAAAVLGDWDNDLVCELGEKGVPRGLSNGLG